MSLSRGSTAAAIDMAVKSLTTSRVLRPVCAFISLMENSQGLFVILMWSPEIGQAIAMQPTSKGWPHSFLKRRITCSSEGLSTAE